MVSRSIIDSTKLFFSTSDYPGNIESRLYNEAFEFLGINAVFKPLNLRNISDADYKELLNTLNQFLDAGGISISEEFKRKTQQLAWSSPIAVDAHSVDTVTFVKEGDIYYSHGHNVDAMAFNYACNHFITGKKKARSALVYGKGPMSDSIAYILDKHNVPFVVTDNKNRIDIYDNCNLFVNISDEDFDDNLLNSYTYIVDTNVAVVNASRIIKQANRLGAIYVTGATLFYYKMCEQFEIFTKQVAPKQLFLDVLIQEGYDVQIPKNL